MVIDLRAAVFSAACQTSVASKQEMREERTREPHVLRVVYFGIAVQGGG